MIFAFTTFVKKHPLTREKTHLKSEKNILQISQLIFWMLKAAKYLIYYFSFDSLLLHLIQAELDPFSFIWNIWMRKK